jgi:hypothetical protein
MPPIDPNAIEILEAASALDELLDESGNLKPAPARPKRKRTFWEENKLGTDLEEAVNDEILKQLEQHSNAPALAHAGKPQKGLEEKDKPSTTTEESDSW